MDGVTVFPVTDDRWADFVATHPAATPFHHPDWIRVVAGCYRYPAFVVAVSDAKGAIRGLRSAQTAV